MEDRTRFFQGYIQRGLKSIEQQRARGGEGDGMWKVEDAVMSLSFSFPESNPALTMSAVVSGTVPSAFCCVGVCNLAFSPVLSLPLSLLPSPLSSSPLLPLPFMHRWVQKAGKRVGVHSGQGKSSGQHRCNGCMAAGTCTHFTHCMLTCKFQFDYTSTTMVWCRLIVLYIWLTFGTKCVILVAIFVHVCYFI